MATARRSVRSSSRTTRASSQRGKQSKSARGSGTRKQRTPSILEQAADAAGHVVGTVAAHVLPAVPHDPIAMLEQDHRRFEDLLGKGEKTTARAGKQRVALLATLKAELAAHELVEEKVFYPALEPHRDARDVVLEGYEEHHVADILVRELERLSPDDKRWSAKFKVLKENIEHHIEEEEGDMFKTARDVLTRDRLAELGTKMEEMKGARRKRS
jgi:hypothetical protein